MKLFERFNIKNILLVLKNSAIAIVRCEFLLKLDAGKFFLHIVYTFIVFAAVIWVSLSIDNSLAKVESGKELLQEMRIIHTDRIFNLSSIERRASVSKMLEEMGSSVKEPEKPAFSLSNATE